MSVCRLRKGEELVRLLEEQGQLLLGRVAVASHALRLAKSYSGPVGQTVELALRAMSTVLWEFYFDSKKRSRNVELDFYLATGFKLSLREHRLTNRNRKLKRIRSVEWNGCWYDITPHVKLPQKGVDFRVHYAPDWGRSLIVIGSCGPHLETSGTRLSR